MYLWNRILANIYVILSYYIFPIEHLLKSLV